MIGFLVPWALLGLVAAAIPFLLHLRSRHLPPTVPFPAVQYLNDATREQRRRLRLGQWLLLLIRTLLVVALVLAAAGPTVPMRGAPVHAPVALVLVVDNSLLSGARLGGTTRLDELRQVARGVLARATPGDRLWLLAADGIPRRGDPAELSRHIDSLAVSDARMDLGRMVTTAGRILDADPGPGAVVVLSDLQRGAVTAGAGQHPVLAGTSDGPAIPNRGVGSVLLGPQPWGPDGGRVVVTVTGNAGPASVPVSVTLGTGPTYQGVAGPGRPAAITIPARRPGWYLVTVEIPPDELRRDDRWVGAVEIAPPAAVRWSAGDRFLAAAFATLAAAKRITPGEGLRFGTLGPGASIVLPPEDPARVGALDRALAARGVTWRFGALQEGRVEVDSSAVLLPVGISRRYALIPSGSGRTGVVLTAGGAPWLVRSGDVLLLGSRLDPTWTDLPLSAGFVPFLDALVNRLASDRGAVLTGAVGEPVLLPDRVTEVRRGAERWAVERGAEFTPPTAGVYWLRGGGDTAGVLVADPDPRESDLTPVGPAVVEGLWPGSRVVSLDQVAEEAYTLGGRTDLRGALLWLVLFLALAEMLVASAGVNQKRTVK